MMRNMLFRLSLILMFLSGLGSSFVHAQTETDNKIEQALKESHVFKVYLEEDSIAVDSKDGVVVLTGSVAHENHRNLAQETAANVPGVVKVDNQLQVKQQGAAGTMDDTWIGLKVRWALLFHRSVSVTQTEISVNDGIVTLRGRAESQAQKDLTAEYAGDVEGVREVKNEMIVIPDLQTTQRTLKDKIDDASITAQVKMALMRHRSTNGIATKVKTMDGVVMLTGAAQSVAEKDLVSKIAGDINGVKSVVNNMDVKM